MFTAPRHPYTQALLGAYPNIHADRRTLEVIPGMPPDLRNPPPGCRFAPRCAFAMPVCTEVVPPEVTFADGVRVACHLYPTSDAPMAGEAARDAAPHVVLGHDAIPHEHPDDHPPATTSPRRPRPTRRPRRDRGPAMTDPVPGDPEAQVGEELLRLEDLEVHFPIRGGLLDSAAQAGRRSSAPSTGST